MGGLAYRVQPMDTWSRYGECGTGYTALQEALEEEEMKPPIQFKSPIETANSTKLPIQPNRQFNQTANSTKPPIQPNRQFKSPIENRQFN